MTNPSANGAASGGNDRPEATDGALAASSAGMNLLVGLLLTVMGLGHLYGVIVTAQMRGYAYDFRLAALLLVGIALVLGGALCLSAIRGLARGQRSAWARALIGTLILLFVLVPLMPLQPDMAPGLSILVAVDLIVLLLAAPRGFKAG